MQLEKAIPVRFFWIIREIIFLNPVLALPYKTGSSTFWRDLFDDLINPLAKKKKLNIGTRLNAFPVVHQVLDNYVIYRYLGGAIATYRAE